MIDGMQVLGVLLISPGSDPHLDQQLDLHAARDQAMIIHPQGSAASHTTKDRYESIILVTERVRVLHFSRENELFSVDKFGTEEKFQGLFQNCSHCLIGQKNLCGIFFSISKATHFPCVLQPGGAHRHSGFIRPTTLMYPPSC